MIGVILAAGYGKRLAQFSGGTSKCLVSINGMCLIDYNLRLLEMAGITQIVIVVGHDASRIKEHIDGCFSGLCITYVIQEYPKGIADAIRCALPKIGYTPFFMCLADEILVSPSLENMENAFRTPDIDGVCGIVKSTGEQIIGSYTVDIDDQYNVLRMKEKPNLDELYNDYRGTGYCLIRPALAELVTQTPINQIRGEYELVDWLTTGLGCGIKLMAAIVGQHSININTENDLALARALVGNGGI